MNTQEHVALRLHLLRQERGWSQSRLATEVRRQGLTWSPGTVAQIEAGVQRADRLAELMALCAAFEVSLAELLGEEGPPGGLLLPDGREVPLSAAQAALRGVPMEGAGEVPKEDDPYEVARLSRKAGMDPEEFRFYFEKRFRRKFVLYLRDELVMWHMQLPKPVSWIDCYRQVQPEEGRRWFVIPGDNPSFRAMRGHATRWIISEVKDQAFELQPIEIPEEYRRKFWHDVLRVNFKITKETPAPQVEEAGAGDDPSSDKFSSVV